MEDIKRRLDKAKARFADPKFLANEGLLNEVGVYVLQYEPKHEMIVRDFVRREVSNQAGPYRAIEFDLYRMFLGILKDMHVLDAVPEMEEKKGKEYLLDQLHKAAEPKDFLAKMKADYVSQQFGDVLFLTSVGVVHPFMRAHRLLEIVQSSFPKAPIVVFYPGGYDGQTMVLFDKFKDDNYYRAFNLLD